MSKRVSIEAKFLDWLEQAPLSTVESIMGIASARVKARRKAEQPAAVPRVRKVARRKTNASLPQTDTAATVAIA